MHPVEAFGWAARGTSGFLSPFKFFRRATDDKDVKLKVLYCGICHSDIHQLKNEWGSSLYPLVPGHEIVGEVTEVGSKVEKFTVGEKVAVGGYCGSCRSCGDCSNDLENYCSKGIATYNAIYNDGTPTCGGYSDMIVIDEHFMFHAPENLPLGAAAPLLCAGITMYSPLRYFGLDKAGLHIGVVGLGGLGHVGVKFAKAMGLKVSVISTSQKKENETLERLGADSFLAVKFAKAFGANVTVISTSPSKKEESLQHLGVDKFLLSNNLEQIQGALNSLDGIIDTVSAVHPLLPYLGMLKPHGKLVIVGAIPQPLEMPVFPLILGKFTLRFLR